MGVIAAAPPIVASIELRCAVVSLFLGRRGNCAITCARSRSFLAGLRADTLHLVGHSMGGLVILELFESGAARRGRWRGPPDAAPRSHRAARLSGSRQPRRAQSRAAFPRPAHARAHWPTRCCCPSATGNGARSASSASSRARCRWASAGSWDRSTRPSDGTVLLTETHLVGRSSIWPCARLTPAWFIRRGRAADRHVPTRRALRARQEAGVEAQTR